MSVMSDVIRSIASLSSLLWAITAIVVLWKLLPHVLKWIPALGQRLTSADVMIKVGPVQLSLQDASQNFRKQVRDIQHKLNAHLALAELTNGSQGDMSYGGALGLARVLWVDDQPEHNAFEREGLMEEVAELIPAASTREGLDRMRVISKRADVIITNVARTEDGERRPDAGLELIKALKSEGFGDVPILVYCSPENVARVGDEAQKLGARIATNSPLELFACLREVMAERMPGARSLRSTGA